jgi:hypothetical protein
VVEEVENQILEMLSRLEVTEYSRADVLAVLAKLDPPEAYVPEDAAPRPILDPAVAVERVAAATETVTAAARAGVQASVTAASQMAQTVRAQWNPAWMACFAAGLGVFTLLLGFAFVAVAGPGESAVFGALLLLLMAGTSTLLGALSLYYLRGSKEHRFALVAALLATLLYPMLIVDGIIVAIGIATFPVSVALLALIFFVAFNGAIGRALWKWAQRKPVEQAQPVATTAAAPLVITE